MILFSFVVEMISDILSMTLVIYISGGFASPYFTLYILYCIAAGTFYSPRVAFLSAVLSVISYSIMLGLLDLGLINAFEFPKLENRFVHFLPSPKYINFSLLLLFLPVIVYGVRISDYFSTLKEKALEEKNTQLTALNRISSTIKRVSLLKHVVQSVLKGVIEGLGYEVCLLVLLDKRDQGHIQFYAPENNFYVKLMEDKFGFSFGDFKLPSLEDNSIFQSMKRNQIIFRKELSELTIGVVPEIPKELASDIQKETGFKKIIITPLVAERKIIGALVGISTNQFIDESSVGVLENFTNQSALALDSAMLIEELKYKNIELERANRIKSEFLAVMSHELRTPLTAVIGFSELLLEEVLGPVNHDQKESLREVLKNGEHLLHLINSILDLAKVEAGKMKLDIEPLNLNDMVVDIKNSVSPLIDKKNISFNHEVPNDIPLLYADQRKLRQIILNLISNAIKFTPENGSVTLRATFRETKKVSEFVIEVEDTGIGIDIQNKEQIFEAFKQVDGSYTRQFQGTGLGLALTKQFVELHGGTIDFISEVGKGSNFIIRLPQERSEELKSVLA